MSGRGEEPVFVPRNPFFSLRRRGQNFLWELVKNADLQVPPSALCAGNPGMRLHPRWTE